jgi:hypothetical protein
MSENEFKARLDLAINDLDALTQLAQELDAIEAPWVRSAKFKVAGARLKMRSSKPSSQYNSSKQPTDHWLGQFGLFQPDGRPLYRYRMSKANFEALGEHLRGRAAVMRYQAIVSDAALFVMWAAEWFRRSYAGGGEEWARLGLEIGLSCEQAHWRKLADRGLKFWQIPALKLNRIHHRLIAIARQGGFPLAALGDRNGNSEGWAASYLKRLVGVLLSNGVDDPDYALAQAHMLSEIIPSTWANEGMIEISAELAAGVVGLRREAEAAGISDGALAVAWLDTHHKEWRDELPVAFDDDAAQALLGGLMRARAIKGGGNSISARRKLVFENGERFEKLELLLDGKLASDDPKSLQRLGEEWSRLRIYAAGKLAQYLGGELAVAVAEHGGIWAVRPSASRTHYDVPFAVQADIELRGDGVRVAGPFAMPRGSSLHSGLLVLQQEGEGYFVKSSGSGSFRDDEVHLEMPDDWVVEAREEGSDLISCGTTAGRQLVCVRGEALVRSTYDDTYLIRTGQDSDQRDRLVIIGDVPAGCRSVDGMNMICGRPQLLVGNDHMLRAAGSDVGWRHGSGRVWNRMDGALPPGVISFAWRDSETGHVRATGTVVVLPDDFKVVRQVTGDDIVVTVTGWPALVTSTMGLQVSSSRWRVPVVPRERALPILALSQNEQPLLNIAIELPQRAWIHNWQEGPVPRDASISLAMLHQYVARSERCELLADVYGRDGIVVAEGHASWMVEGELALAAIRDDIAAILRPLGDIGARVKLNFNDSFNNFWFVSEFDHELRRETGGFVPSHAVADERVRIIARSLCNPAAAPQDHGTYSLLGHRPVQLPHLYGDWLIYLKSDDRVLSRPAFLRGTPLAVQPSTALGQAMAVPDRTGRLAALQSLAIAISEAPLKDRECVREILDLALSLDGLPPATFDILSSIARQPMVGALMLFAARESEVEVVMRLADGLPFSWSLIPRSVWDKAAAAQAETMFEALGELAEAPILVGKMIANRRQSIASYDETLRPMLDLPTEHVALREAANSFITRSHDRVRQGSSPFRPRYISSLPAWDFSPAFWRALDAPVAAALAAQGQINLETQHIRCIKDVSRSHPKWFAQGYAAKMKEK